MYSHGLFAKKWLGPSTSMATARPRSAMSSEKLSSATASISCGTAMRVSVSETSRCNEEMVTRPVLVCSHTAFARSSRAPRSGFEPGFEPASSAFGSVTSHSSSPSRDTSQCANASEAW